MQKAIKKTYKNGLRVVTVPMKDNPTVTVLVLVGAGSDYERKKVNGITHFLEHMCFKGTIKRPTAKDISHELDALGAQYNAFTNHEMTGYYAKADAKKFRDIFEIISDIYLNSTFPEAEIEKEKGVIIEEINMYEDMPQRQMKDLFQEALYGDQPAGRNIAGTKENVRNMKREDFVKYKKEHYVAEGTVIIIAGNVTTAEVDKEVKKHFGGIHGGNKKGKVKTRVKQQKPNIALKYKKTDQTHFVLGFRSFDLFNKNNHILTVLGGILGAGMSSRLFIKLREEMGVAYYVSAYNNPALDHGSFQISAGVNNARLEEVIKEILKECFRLKNELVSQKELSKVKSYLIGNLKLSLESTDDLASFYGGQEIMKNKMETIEEKTKKINLVTAKQIKDIANKVFVNKNINLAIIGPLRNGNNLTKILSF